MKRKVLFLAVMLLCGVVGQIFAQRPNVPHTNFSTMKGEVTDPRDGKKYAYKQYGDFYWFMQNLNWDGYDGKDLSTKGTVGHWGSQDPDGSKFGRFYKTKAVANICPPGWESPSHGSYKDLINTIASEYPGVAIRLHNSDGWTVYDAMQYLRAGGLKNEHADGVWEEVTGTADPMSDQIQFNLLPSGGFNGTDYIAGQEVGKKTYLMMDGDDRYQNNYPVDNAANGVNALRHIRGGNTYGMVRCIAPALEGGTSIITPYNETVEVKQIVSEEMERERMAQNMKKFDKVLTGFYIAKGKKIEVDVQEIQTSADGASVQLVIGTPALLDSENTENTQAVKTVNLNLGINTIDADQHFGGMIYIRYVAQNNNPQGKAKVTFTSNSQHQRAPYYVYGTTTNSEFITMLKNYPTPEVMFSTDHAVVVASRSAVLANSLKLDKDLWLKDIDKLLEIEDEISGLDDTDSNPIHHRLKAGEIRHLLVQTTADASPNASDERTAYPNPSTFLDYIIMPSRPGTGSWTMGHEIGHQHQQGAYLIPQAGESTVNIYSIKVASFFDKGGQPYIRTPQTKIENNISKYLALPDSERLYEMKDSELEAIAGINRDEVRMVPWEQMFYIFGDQYYKNLHRITREEKRIGGGNDEKKAYLITRASLISGYDMRGFFDAWGIKVEEAYYQKQIDQTITNAGLPKPPRAEELATVGGEKFYNGDYAGWLPLTMTGITSSQPDVTDEAPADRLASKNKYCDYSSQTGTITDPRDGKEYPFKKIGYYDWFMTNLDWDGYDGKDPSTKGTSGIYAAIDPDGKVYGRYYATYANHQERENRDDPEKWCPTGWKYATESDFKQLMEDIKTEYNLSSISESVKCMKCGGDRDDVADGLWAKGAAESNTTLAAQVGINILPAGVAVEKTGAFETADSDGLKASFVNNGWYHNIFMSGSNQMTSANRNFIHHGSVRCVRLTASMKTQEITFQPLEQVQHSQEDFEPRATASSGLSVSYSSSNTNVATIIDGKISVVAPGTTIITASQDGNNEYHKAVSVSRSLTVIPTVINEDDVVLTINGAENISHKDVYEMPCGANEQTVQITVNVPKGVTVSPSNTLTKTYDAPGNYTVDFQLKSGDDVVDMSVKVLVPFIFDRLIHTKWNHVYIVNNNSATNGGYNFTQYAWYKNGAKVGDGQYYNAKDSEAALYRVELVTDKGEFFATCPVTLTPNTMKVTLSTNQASAGSTIYLDSSLMPSEFFNKSTVSITNMSGNVISGQSIKNEITPLVLPQTKGLYIINVKSEMLEEGFKVIVK